MNWEAIGAIGEVVGAVGVILTLAYLAIQIRSSAKATESQVLTDLSAEMEGLTTAIARDEFLSSTYLAAQQHVDLTPEQRVRLGWWFTGYMRVCESHFLQRHLKATRVDLESPLAANLRRMSDVPFFSDLLRRAVKQSGATPEFLRWLQRNVLDSDKS